LYKPILILYIRIGRRDSTDTDSKRNLSSTKTYKTI